VRVGQRVAAGGPPWASATPPGKSYVDNPGMQPELYFELEVDWSHGNDVRGGNVFTFTLPYDAIAWTESQRILGGLRGVLP
jgi:hypothetical protein